MMRITVNGVRVDASVKKTILPEFWSAAKGKALEKKREYKELNLYLDSIRLRIMKIQRELEIEGVAVFAGSVLAVSYTHLDVYKRQALFWLNHLYCSN